jgi:hypothetical protein
MRPGSFHTFLMSVSAAQHLCGRIPFIAAFARLPGCGNVTQDRGAPGDRGRVFDPSGESVLDSEAPRIVRAGLPDGFPFLVAQGAGLRAAKADSSS